MLVTGSSIAGYSVLPARLERIPELRGRNVRIFLLSHQGLNGLDLWLYTERLMSLDPDWIVLPVNMVDFRLERPLMTRNLARLDGPDRREALLDLEADLVHAEMRPLAPFPAWKKIARLPVGVSSPELLLAALSPLYRYKEIGLVPVRVWTSHRFSSGRSYLHYAGIPIDDDGVTRRGWTGRHFSFLVPEQTAGSGWLVEAHPRTPDGSVLETWFVGPSTKCTDPPAVRARHDLRPGWQKVPVSHEAAGKRLCAQVSPGTWVEEESDTLGVRLQEHFGVLPAQIDGSRQVRREDVLYKSMTDAAYRASFERRILQFDRKGMEYLNALEMAKKEWARRPFDRELPALSAFDSWRRAVSAGGVNLLVVEAPENPISRRWTEGTAWARGFSRFLSRDPGPPGRYFYADETRLLPMQMFSDYHHQTYFGAEIFTDRLGLHLVRLLDNH